MAEMASAELSLSTSSQEEESTEYVGFDRTLRPPSNSSGSTTAAILAGNSNNGNSGSGNNNNNNNNSSNNAANISSSSNASTSMNTKKYDVMKADDYDASTLIDLTQLRHQRDLGEQVTFFQQLYVAAINQLQSSDRSNADIVAENARLKQQNNILEHKLMRLDSANGNAASSTTAYYCDYAEVPSNRSSSGGSGSGSKCDGTCAESEKLLEELHLSKERNTDLIKERNLLATEREKYKKNFGTAMLELENVKKERNFYRDARDQFNIQRDLMEKDIQKLKSMLTMETNKVLTITMQRARIEEELNQLLSEKDNVLQEHQKMSDDLSAANKELEKLKKEEQIYKTEIKSLQQSVADLKKRDLLKSRESSWSKEFSDSKDDFKELDKLRKQLEKLNSEVERAHQDAEEAKGVRDWAISQREKIVQERDSVKTLCDNLRKERDKAISDLLSAIRDSEKIKKQKDEAQKKIDALKEQIESQNIDSSSRRSFRMSNYEAEDMLDIELINYHSHSDIGIILDDTHNRQLVCGVTNASPAFGKLKINDVICKVNNLECANISKRLVFDEIRASAPRCNLLVSRTRHSKRHFYTVQLNLQDSPNHGLHLDTGVFITKIEPNSLAALEPELDVGDRVLSINNKTMEGMQTLDDVMSLLNDERNDSISIFALKNVQDVSFCEAQRRMTTSSAQTDSIDSMHRVTSGKHPSKIQDLLNKFKKQMHISKPGAADNDHFAQENDALAALDSVLSENSSSGEKKKKEKRSKKEKEAAAKSMGTWPRTNILNATHENPTGTIVQREKKRTPLALFTPGPINVDKDDEQEESADQPPPLPLPSKPLPALLSNININNNTNNNNNNGSSSSSSNNMRLGNAIKTNPNRNSNPIPSLFQNTGHQMSGNYMRHSIFGTPSASVMESEPLIMEHATKPLQRPAPIMGANMRVKMPTGGHGGDKYAQQQRSYQNRYSLNITPTEFYKTSGQQAQQQVINATNNSGQDFQSRRHFLDMYCNKNATTTLAQHPALFTPLNNNNNNNTTTTTTTTSNFLRNNNNNNNNNQHHHHHQQQQQQQQPQQQQSSMDMISLKSQNSIDSILSAKSPPISEYALSNYIKRGVPMPQAVKNVAKYPSDSESIASGIVSTSANAAVGGIFHTNRHTQLFPSFTQNAATQHHHAISRHIRHSSPLTLPSPPPPPLHPHATNHHSNNNNNNNNAGTAEHANSSVDKFDLDYGQHHQSHASYVQEYPSAAPTVGSQAHYHAHMGVAPLLGTAGIYEGGTFPRKKEHPRLRIPSNPSVASKSSGVKNSSGSIDHHYGVGMMSTPPIISNAPIMHHSAVANAAANGGGSGRGSPMPQVHVEVLSHGGNKRNSNAPVDFLCPGDLRRVTIEKSDKSLGITIQCNNNGGGIFVSTVADKSIATRAGLQVGDQLLEVCGLNMRSATNDIAANVLRQCGNSITMLVQYNPEKFHSAEYDGTNNLDTETPVNHSGSPTPRNSPRPPARGVMALMPSMNMNTPSSLASVPNIGLPGGSSDVVSSPPAHALLPPSSSLLSKQSSKDQSFADSLENQSDISSSQDIPSSAATTTTASTTSTVYEEEPRYVTLHMDKSKNLGIKLFGGNKVGIFVHDVHPGSPSDHAGIRKGDQILEYNGVDLRCVTAEQAANEISKFTDNVTMLVQNKLKKLKQIKDKSGDSFYIRVGFDRLGDLNEGDLRFVKDEVLYVDNTVFNGTFGMWRAWKLDAKGHRKECGIIPSQMKVEEEIRTGEVVDGNGSSRRDSTSARRSFFRRKKHQRSSSRDSTEIASFSNTQLSFFPDAGIMNDDGGVLSYQRVERLDSPVRRPVLIIGPLSECVMDRLTIDFSNLFKLCEVTTMDCSQDAMEEGLQENIFVDYRRRGNKFECTTVEAINSACKNDRRHCILDISISAVERLQRLQIYPIVLLLRFKSAKQIREIRDFGTDKISAKAAKEMYERALKLESDYKQYISAVIPGVSIKHMCTQIKDAVDKEQDKLLWVPCSSP